MAATHHALVGRSIFIASLVSLAVVWRPFPVQAAELLFSPSAAVLTVGQTFTTEVIVSSDGQAINAAEAVVTWPIDLLTIVTTSIDQSIFSYWSINPRTTNNFGRLEFSGGLPTPGYGGPAGLLVAITWRAIAPGQAMINLVDGRVLADDGYGTDLLETQGIGIITIAASSSAGVHSMTTSSSLLPEDTTPPEPFTIEFRKDRGATDPTPEAVFTTSDVNTGVSYYTLAYDGQPPQTVTSPTTLEILSAGEHQVVVTAYDLAGNSRQSTASFVYSAYPPPSMTAVTSSILLLEPVTVRGRANPGDRVTIMIDGQPVGRTMVGQTADGSGVTIRLPWSFSSRRFFGPGQHDVRAMATSSTGRESVWTDPVTFTVAGHSLIFGGQTLATVAIAPIVVGVLLVIVAAIILVTSKMVMSFIRLHQREVFVEQELDDLRRQVTTGTLSTGDTSARLADIERDLAGKRPRGRSRTNDR